MNRDAKSMRTDLALAVFFLLIGGLFSTATAYSQKINDQTITRAVKDLLSLDQGLQAKEIGVETVERVVTLSGTVNNLLTRDQARGIAGSIKGVRAVVNTLTVSATARSDGEIQADVQQALKSDPATATRGFQVTVSSGNVHLDGIVKYWREKQLVETVAEGVRGVRGVRNDLRIIYSGSSSDVDISAAIHDSLVSDALVLNGDAVQVRVDHGNVFLSGIVGSASSRWQAGLDAWGAGVHSVDIAGLIVHDWEIDRMLRSRASLYYQPDATIQKSVTRALDEDPRVAPNHPTVMVQDGVITLSGTIDHLQAKVAAASDAQNTIGVFQVTNVLKVQPTTPPPGDNVIASHIQEAWLRDSFLAGEPLTVSVVGGKATLNGHVRIPTEKARAQTDASEVSGVVSIVNDLTIRSAETPANDGILRINVENRLFWNPFVNNNQIHVSVRNGVVKLEGTVRNASESGAAELAAEAAGARRVENLLVVSKAERVYPSSIRF